MTFLTIHVKMWVVVVGACVFALAVWAVSSNLKEVDRRQRDADARDAIEAAYAVDVRAYDIAVRARADCLDRVTRSDDNRGQHQQIVTAFLGLKEVFPESEGLARVVDVLVADLEAGPLLSSQPFTEADCPPMPIAPVLPPELGGEAP